MEEWKGMWGNVEGRIDSGTEDGVGKARDRKGERKCVDMKRKG